MLPFPLRPLYTTQKTTTAHMPSTEASRCPSASLDCSEHLLVALCSLDPGPCLSWSCSSLTGLSLPNPLLSPPFVHSLLHIAAFAGLFSPSTLQLRACVQLAFLSRKLVFPVHSFKLCLHYRPSHRLLVQLTVTLASHETTAPLYTPNHSPRPPPHQVQT